MSYEKSITYTGKLVACGHLPSVAMGATGIQVQDKSGDVFMLLPEAESMAFASVVGEQVTIVIRVTKP